MQWTIQNLSHILFRIKHDSDIKITAVFQFWCKIQLSKVTDVFLCYLFNFSLINKIITVFFYFSAIFCKNYQLFSLLKIVHIFLFGRGFYELIYIKLKIENNLVERCCILKCAVKNSKYIYIIMWIKEKAKKLTLYFLLVGQTRR